MRVELYPKQRAAELDGVFRFVNRGGTPVDSLHVQLNANVDTRTLTFDRTARVVVDDSVLRYRIYAQGFAVILILAFAWLRSRGGN